MESRNIGEFSKLIARQGEFAISVVSV